MAKTGVDIIVSRGCAKLLVGVSTPAPHLNSLRTTEMLSLASSSASEASMPTAVGPFSGLVICVTGLSKEARKQVMNATERLGGQYSPSLHPQCTHLVVQSFSGRKFEHALKHGPSNGLVVVTFGWFVDSIRRNARLNEKKYMVKSINSKGIPLGEMNTEFPSIGGSCIPIVSNENQHRVPTSKSHLRSSSEDLQSIRRLLTDVCIYIDSDISKELKKKVVEAGFREGATFVDRWFIGCNASHVVCEGPAIQKYVGHVANVVTPVWILKTAKENRLQQLVHLSSDLARQVSVILENAQDTDGETVVHVTSNPTHTKSQQTCDERKKTVELAKLGVRNRRRRRMQSCQTPIYPITPSNLLECICWSISEPASSACIYLESSATEDPSASDARASEASFENLSRPLRDSEKREVVFKNHFLTVLFPIDRFGELGPSSKTFFSNDGFTCSQVLEHIYNFYQDYMSLDEVEMAIHTDSKHADRLRLLYASKESTDHGFIPLKRIEFLGSRRSFESLKRVNGENNSNIYELLLRS